MIYIPATLSRRPSHVLIRQTYLWLKVLTVEKLIVVCAHQASSTSHCPLVDFQEYLARVGAMAASDERRAVGAPRRGTYND